MIHNTDSLVTYITQLKRVTYKEMTIFVEACTVYSNAGVAFFTHDVNEKPIAFFPSKKVETERISASHLCFKFYNSDQQSLPSEIIKVEYKSPEIFGVQSKPFKIGDKVIRNDNCENHGLSDSRLLFLVYFYYKDVALTHLENFRAETEWIITSIEHDLVAVIQRGEEQQNCLLSNLNTIKEIIEEAEHCRKVRHKE